MGKEDDVAREARPPRLWDEQAVSLLMEQFRLMLERSVKQMKLEVVENIGAMLARRSGIDREIRDLAEQLGLLAKSVQGFGTRLAIVEKACGLAGSSGRGPIGPARDLGKRGRKRPGGSA